MNILRTISKSLWQSGLLQALVVAGTAALVAQFPDYAAPISAGGGSLAAALPSPALANG